MARIFTAINIPQDIRKKLASYHNEELPARWTKPENLHVTVDFIGFVRDDKIPELIEETKKKAENVSPFFIKLEKICFAPLNVSPPRMVWATGETPKEFLKLSNNTLHVTLAKIKKWQFKRFGFDQEIEKDIKLEFMAESLDLMESKLKKGGPGYILLQKNYFKQ